MATSKTSSALVRLIAPVALALGLVAAGCATTTKQSQIAVGNQYAKDGLLREASEAYKKALAQNAGNSTAHRNLGMVLVKLGDYKGATKHLERSMTRYEKDFDANYYLGESYRAQDKYAEAIFRYKKALKIKDGDVRALKPLAWSYFKIRYYSEALSIARELQKVASDDDQVGIITARTLLKLKRSKEALTAVRAQRKTIARSSRAFYNSVEGDILLDLGDTAGATKAYREALKDQPLLAGALLGLGRCMLGEGKTKAAITYMERAVRIRPRLTEAHYLLAKAYEPTDKEKSLRYYSYFRKQASADPEFIGMLPEVKRRMATLQATPSAQGTPASAPANAATPANGVPNPAAPKL
jgi:tetratricopeptide (TPR) repeat protein